jgi:geranylgeranyl diphosphate synthase type I
VLVALALDGAPADEASRLDAALGSDLDEVRVAELRGIIDRSGAHAQVESVITELAARAITALRTADIDGRAREVLLELAAAATDRLS